MMTREEVESYLLRMGLDFEEVEEGLWVIQSSGESGITVVANYSPPLLLLRLPSSAERSNRPCSVS